MILFSLIILFVLLLAIGFFESYVHSYYLKKIPLRIHVNGARGKSSVTRLIASGLRESGKKVYAKTTGSSPRIINDKGVDISIHRLRSASIGEQVQLIRSFAKKKIDILVIECMAVQPQYQWISEHKMIKSKIGVITNVRPDHLDEMGYTMKDIAASLSNSIPNSGSLVIHQDNFSKSFVEVAKRRNSDVKFAKKNIVDDSFMKKFDYFEHQDNVELAVAVCEIVGVDRSDALKGILKNKPDPGALLIWKILIDKEISYFINAFAANDPQSTFEICDKISNRFSNHRVCIFLNTRSDRQYRTHQLLSLIYDKIIPDKLIIRGSKLDSFMKKYDFKSKGIDIHQFEDLAEPAEIIHSMKDLDKYIIFGIGNIVGWGDTFVKEIKRFRLND